MLAELIRDEHGNAVDFRYLEFNAAFEKQLEVKPEEYADHTAREIYGSLDKEWLLRYQSVVDSFEHVKKEVEFGGKWWEINAYPFRDETFSILFRDITRRKHAEREILRSNELHAAMFDNSLQIMQLFKAVRDGSGTIIDFEWLMTNERWNERYGSMTGKRLLAENPAIIDTGLFEDFKRVTETGEPITQEHYYRHEQFDGWFLQTAAKVEDGFLLSTLDITERKRAEEAVRKSEEKFRTLFESIDEAFAVIELNFNENGQVIDFIYREENPNHAQHSGLPNVVGKKASEILPGLEPYWFSIFQKVYETGEPVRGENYNVDTDRWYSYHHSRVGGPGSSLIASVTVDITERKRHEQQQEYLLKLNDAIRPLSDPLEIQAAVTELLATHLKVSQAHYREITGDYIYTSHPYIDGSTAKETTLSNGERQVLASGNMAAYVALPFVNDGKWVATLAVYSTEPREWKQHELELMKETAERTWAAVERAKVEKALREREQQLHELLKLRDEFIGIASHELKTPVTSVKAYAELVMERIGESGNDDDCKLLSRLNVQIDRLTSLINTLLDTTKISEGELKLNPEITDFNELLEERVDEIKRTSNHVFELLLEPMPLVEVDRERIGQVFTNLLSNAIKYSPRGTRITVRTCNESNGVKFSVQDEGLGVSKADAGHVFDKFFRVTKNNLDTYPGMGLGLYIAAQIVQKHQGIISVETEEGPGSVFSFTIPYSK